MATTIDTKVVEMRFDNKQFEENAKQSIKTLDDLATSSSALEKIAGALSGVADTFQNSDIGGKLSDLNDKFSFFGTFTRRVFEEVSDWAISKLSNLFNFATSGFQQLYSSSVFSTQQMSAGWDKYADKTSAVQTIMAATGKDMGTINEQLDKLNWFTDETSYNFVDMVSNIGKFTSAGIELEDSVVAMEGIANWAARSGAGIEGASRAMYNLSQAMGMGSLRTQDWMSIENANMATKEFKELAIQIALANGNLTKLKDNTIVDTGTGDVVSAENFRETLKSGWLTKNVLTATLKQYGNFTEEIYGYYNNFDMTTGSFLKKIEAYQEAVANNDTKKQAEIIQSLTDNLSDQAEEGLDVVDMLKKLSSEEYALGRASFRAASEAKTFKEAMDSVGDAASTAWMKVFESIFGDYEYAKGLWTDFANELYDIFVGPMEAVYEGLGKWLGGTQETATAAREALFNGVKGIYHGLQNLLAPIKNALYTVMGIETDEDKRYQQIMNGVANGMVKITNALNKAAKVLEKFSNAHGEAIYNFFYGIFSVLKLIGSVIGAVIKGFAGVGGAAGGLAGGAVEAAGSVGELLTKFTEFVQNSGVLEKITQAVAAGVRAIGKAFEFIKPYVATVFENLGPALKAVWEWLEPVRIKMGELFESLKTYVSDGSLASDAANVFTKIKDAMVALWEWLEPVRALISKVFSKLVEIAKGIDFSWITDMKAKMAEANGPIEKFKVLCGEIKDQVMKMVNTVKPYIIQFASVVADKLGMSLEEFWNLLKGMDFKSIYKIIKALFVGKTVKSIWDFTDAFGSAGKMFDKVGGFFKQGTESLSVFAKNYNKDKLSTILLSIAACIASIALSLWLLSSVDPDKMQKALIGVSIIIGELAAMIAIISIADAGNAADGIGDMLKGIAYIVAVIALAIFALSAVDADKLSTATSTMTVVLAEIVAMIFVLGKMGELDKNIKKIGTTLILVSLAVVILGKVINNLSSSDPANMIASTFALISVLAALTAMAYLLSDKSVGVGFGIAMLLLAAGIKIIIGSLVELGQLPFKKLVAILTAIVAVVAIIGVVAAVVEKSKKNTEKAIKPSSFAKSVLAIAVALIALAAAIAIITVSLAALSAANLGRVSAAMAILLVSFSAFALLAKSLGSTAATSIAIIGAGILALGAGVLMLSEALAVFIALAPAIAAAGDVIVAAIGILMAGVIVGLIEGIDLVLQAIQDSIPLICETVLVIIEEVLNLIVNSASLFFEALGMLVVELGDFIVDILPTLNEYLIKILDFLIENVYEWTTRLLQIVLEVIYGIIDGLTENLPTIVAKIFAFISALFSSIGKWLGDEKNQKTLFDSIDDLLAGIIEFIFGFGARFLEFGEELVKKIKKGILNGWPALLRWFFDKFLGLYNFVHDLRERFMEGGKRIIEGIKEGVQKVWSTFTDWLKKKLGGIYEKFCEIMDIHSPSRVMAYGGEMIVAGIGQGINDNFGYVDDAMDNLGDTILRPLGETLNDASAMAEDGFSITPVMNMDDVKSNASMLSGLMGTGSMGLKINDESMNELAENMADATNSKSIVDAIKDLREEMAEYSEAIKNIKMVVNSGALVGEIVSDMDSALGGRAVLAGRGI